MTGAGAKALSRTISAPTAMGLAARIALARLENESIDPGPLLSRSRLRLDDLVNEKRVSAAAQIRFLNEAGRATRDEWIGVNLAQGFDLRRLGMLYYVAASSKSLRDGFRRLERYARLGNEAIVGRIASSDDFCVVFNYSGVARHEDHHQVEILAVILVRLFSQLLGRKIVPRSAQFIHHRSGDLRPIRVAIGCEVQFDGYRDEIQFDRGAFDLPLLGQDPYLNQLMCEACEAALAGRPLVRNSFRTEVENRIAPLLPHAEADVKSVSASMGLSERTFARRMATEGLRFSGILDEMRRDLAVRYLGESKSSDCPSGLALRIPPSQCLQPCVPPVVSTVSDRLSDQTRKFERNLEPLSRLMVRGSTSHAFAR